MGSKSVLAWLVAECLAGTVQAPLPCTDKVFIGFAGDTGGQRDSYPKRPNNRIVGGSEHSLFVDLPSPWNASLDERQIRVLKESGTP